MEMRDSRRKEEVYVWDRGAYAQRSTSGVSELSAGTVTCT